jgi:hypothetical protein
MYMYFQTFAIGSSKGWQRNMYLNMYIFAFAFFSEQKQGLPLRKIHTDKKIKARITRINKYIMRGTP